MAEGTQTMKVERVDDQGDRVLLYGADQHYYVIAGKDCTVKVGDTIEYEPYGANFGGLVDSADPARAVAAAGDVNLDDVITFPPMETTDVVIVPKDEYEALQAALARVEGERDAMRQLAKHVAGILINAQGKDTDHDTDITSAWEYLEDVVEGRAVDVAAKLRDGGEGAGHD